MFLGCPSVLYDNTLDFTVDVSLKPEIPSFHLYMGPLIHLTNHDSFYNPRNEVREGILDSPCLSVHLSVRPSVR